MTKYTGKGVYGAVAMGKISVFKKQGRIISVMPSLEVGSLE